MRTTSFLKKLRFGTRTRGISMRLGRLMLSASFLFVAAIGFEGVAWADPTQLLRDIRPGAAGSEPGAFADVDGTLFFAADDGTHGMELWRSDGTEASTVMVTDINPSGSSAPSDFVNIDGTVYFAADNGVNGVELWKTDGTAAGTVMVKDVNPGEYASFPHELTDLNGTLVFAGYTYTNGIELWKSDGTAAGTVMVKNINPGNYNSSPAELTAVNGMLFFAAYTYTDGVELWKSDGTAAGTVRVKNINSTSNSSYPAELTNINGTLYFSACTIALGMGGTYDAYELWKTDGTESGTVMVKKIYRYGTSSPYGLTNVNGTLFFVADDGTTGHELWKSDGTNEGTVLVREIGLGAVSGELSNLTDVNGMLFFQANDGVNGAELWKSDGTEAGTIMVANINPGGDSSPLDLVNHHGSLYFTADDGTHGRELWFSDRQDPVTVRVADIIPEAAGISPEDLTSVGSRLYFQADDGIHGAEPWVMLYNTAPFVSAIADQSTFHDNPVSLQFTIDDLETDPASLTVEVFSDNQTLLPDGNIALAGSGGTRTLTLTPAASQTGSVEVMVEVSDGQFHTHMTFTVEWYAALVVAPTAGPGVDYTTLDDMFQDADDGDIIILKDGVYSGDVNRNFELNGERHLTIRSANGPENTVIDLQGSGQAFSFVDGDTSIIEGLTFRNGRGTYGGVIYVGTQIGTSPTIRNCIFENNSATSSGGAIYLGMNVLGAHPVIANCRFYGNTADSQGGAVHAFLAGAGEGTAYFEITDCEFTDNVAYYGGAVWTGKDEFPSSSNRSLVKDCQFYRNKATEGGAVRAFDYVTVTGSSFTGNRAVRGGGVQLAYARIENTTFWNNEAVERGGAIEAFGPPASVFHCSFRENRTSGEGGALWVSGDLNLVNSILWENRAEQDGDQISYYGSSSGNALNVDHCDLEGGIAKIYESPTSQGTINALGGNLDTDPRFTLAGDLHLMPDSPCIDAANNVPASGALPSTDKDGNPRILDGNGDAEATADMGACEFESTDFPAAAVSPERLVFTARHGGQLPQGQTLSIRSRGIGTLPWEIVESVTWLRIENGVGTSTGETDTAKVYADYAGLTHGIYRSTFEVRNPLSQASFRTVEALLYITKELHVPSEYGTIQAAIDAAIDGDVVVVADGTYTGIGNKDLDFQGKDIMVRSVSGPQYTIIDCENSGRGVRFHLGEGVSSVFQGFTITGGNSGTGDGGAILVESNASPTIVGCVFHHNETPGNGGAIDIKGSRVTVRNCLFYLNEAGTDGFGHGGGLAVSNYNAEFNILEDCVFSMNAATRYGGGIYWVGDNFTVRRCYFNDNNSSSAYFGGGMYAHFSGTGGTIADCTFRSNSSGQGGGLYVGGGATFDIHNGLFYLNTANTRGGGIYCNGGTANVTNCTINGNMAVTEGGGIHAQSSTVTITNSIIWQNKWLSTIYVSGRDISFSSAAISIDYSDLSYTTICSTYPCSNYISSDPLHVGNEDFRLDPASPCIDRGTTIPWLFSDIRGSVRPVDGPVYGNTDGIAKFDLGAYEYSLYYGGLPGDLTAKGFEGLGVGGALVVTDYDYTIKWEDRDPFPADPRIDQADVYEVRISLENEWGYRIELGTYEVQTSQLNYSIPFVFGAEHIGTWRIRLEMVSDPNHFVLSDEITIKHMEVTRYALSQRIIPPEGADPTVKPDLEDEDACFWSAETNRLYAVKPTTMVVTWYEDADRDKPIPSVVYITYPDKDTYSTDPDVYIHIADAMAVELLPEGTRFDTAMIMFAENDANTARNQFVATREGWSVLMYTDQQATDPDQREIFDVVRTYVWDHQESDLLAPHPILNPNFPHEADWDIGKEATDPEHCPDCKSGWVFFEHALYDGYGTNKAYDRTVREGPIFLVNEDDPTTEKDDLLVVWYTMSDLSGVCWPSKPVRYDPKWPSDAEIIAIAGGLGTGPLPQDTYGQLANMIIYNQPDRSLPGYNPNEEHAAFFTAQGSADPGVFPLRTDLNKPSNRPQDLARSYLPGDRSRPYVLVKYMDPDSGRWNFEVFRVVAQSGSYMLAGTIQPGTLSGQRYYLDEYGALATTSGDYPENSWHLDADGFLVKHAESPPAGYNVVTGLIQPVDPGVVKAYALTGSGVLTDDPLAIAPYSLDVHGVIVEKKVYYRFQYTGIAGQEINPPYPVNQLTFGPCTESYVDITTEPAVLTDKDHKFFSKNGGYGTHPTEDVVLHYYYRMQAGFWYDLDENGVPDKTIGTPLAWLEALDGSFDDVPVPITYSIVWPDPVPTLHVGETLLDAKTQAGETVGLPNVKDQCIVEVLFDQATAEGVVKPAAKLVDPLQEYAVDVLSTIAGDPEHNLPFQLEPARGDNGRWIFKALPQYIQSRLTYDPLSGDHGQLKLKGLYRTDTGEPTLLLNTLSDRDLMEISRAFLADPNSLLVESWTLAGAPNIPQWLKDALVDLQTAGDAGLAGTPLLQTAEMKALTAGDAEGPRLETGATGQPGYYVTLAFNNDTDCAGPVTLNVIRVGCPLYRGEIKVIEPEDVFAEKVTLRHNGDFGGNGSDRWFQWKYLSADFSGIPIAPDTPGENWQDYFAVVHNPGLDSANQADKDTGNGEADLFYTGAQDLTVQGTGQQLLPDKWFSVRYFYDDPHCDSLSEWTTPQLYEGWVKRVMKNINLFDQKVKDFHDTEVNTLASMISLAGTKYEGDVALNSDPENLKQLGIIETYHTLLERAKNLSINQGNPVDLQDINKAILFAASRLGGLYMALANEAYADAVDPTIGFSTEDGQFGTEAPSIFCFEGQVDSLIEEELALLRGRADTGVRPFYNRLIWNFTLGDGEVAYKENYNITDQETDQDGDGVPDAPDGVIDEKDAMVLFPQGHGDAWGHYLSGIKYYYDLLTNPYFTWIPQSEAILVAQTPVSVDYRDERAFADIAAAKAMAGAQIVNLTYRDAYVEDPEAQWQGYRDLDPARSWGVDGWARRAGQGAFFDWVAGNAVLPPEYKGGPPETELQIAASAQTAFRFQVITYAQGGKYLEVYVNGVLKSEGLASDQYQIDGDLGGVTFITGLSAGDRVAFKAYRSVPTVENRTVTTQEALDGWMTLASILYHSGDNTLVVFLNGVEQTFFRDYTLSTNSSQETVVTFTQPIAAGDRVVFKGYDLVEGIQRIDRVTVVELRDIASNYLAVQAQVDQADAGLNPLGVAKDVVPFDIDPQAIDNGQTHFEQIYGKAVQALNNTISVFNHANQSSMLLRHQQDTLADFTRNIEDREADFNNRLVEIFGTPYAEDCGPGKTYPTGWDVTGPDIYHYMYIDPSELMGVGYVNDYEFPVTFMDLDVDGQGALTEQERVVTYNVDTDGRFGVVKPLSWTSRRRTPGEVQLAFSELLIARGSFEKAMDQYDALLSRIENQADLIQAQYGFNRDQIQVLNESLARQISLNESIRAAKQEEMDAQTTAKMVLLVGNAAMEIIPKVIGLATDAMSALRGIALTTANAIAEGYNISAGNKVVGTLENQQAKEIVSQETNIRLTTLRDDFAVKQQLLQLENLVRSEASLRYDMNNLAFSMRQAAMRYLMALTRGQRLLEERLRFRKQTAAQIVNYRYKDMTFRIFRNDALQKYQAQFEMAARYVYLAAKAYDYETALLDADSRAGEAFLTDIVRQRTIGMIQDGQPLTGVGLADPMRRMWQNFQVLKGQMGFNNPQVETNRFSLRQELLRIRMDLGSNDTWREALRACRVDDLWQVSEFKRFCRPFAPEGVPQPGLVIPFSTTVTSGLNFFRWPLGGGDSYYSATNFATKVRSVGVWFSNYNAVGLSQTPRIYLVPVGQDILRSPSYYNDQVRTWHVVDQRLPLPFPIVDAELDDNPGWIPSVDTIFDEMFQIRRHSDFRAYHDSGYLNESEMTFDSRLVGRSVWNTRWLLIIPGQALLYDPDEGLDTFIDGPEVIGGLGERTGYGISDIKLFFLTYAYSGN